MFTAGVIFLWWLSAFLPMLFMTETDLRELTWAQLLVTVLFSFTGLLLGATVALVVVAQSEFWNRPIWPRKK